MQVTLLTEGPPRIFAIVMDEGEEIAGSLDRFAREGGVDAAAFTAIGAVSEATLGFFDLQIREYREIRVTEQAEVASLVGDITRSKDDHEGGGRERMVHGHMVVARADGSTVGGHLMRARVRPTLEVVVTESPAHLRRTYDPTTGLALIDLPGREGAG